MKKTNMYFYVKIFLCTLIYFKFGNSFRNSEVNDIYWNTLEKRTDLNITDEPYFAGR